MCFKINTSIAYIVKGNGDKACCDSSYNFLRRFTHTQESTLINSLLGDTIDRQAVVTPWSMIPKK